MKLKYIYQAIKNGLVPHAIIWRLERLGILLRPYYIVKEGEYDQQTSIGGEQYESYTSSFLGKDEIDEVTFLDGRIDQKQLFRRLDRGHLCFGLRKEGNLVAYMWCDLREFDFAPYRHTLNKNEAYLYDARVTPDDRGKGLAPYFRKQVYIALKQYSKDTFFSFSDYYNKPAIRFKKKLGSQFLKLCLYVNLWNKFSKNWVLRDYFPEQ